METTDQYLCLNQTWHAHTNMKFNNIKKIQSRSECLSPCAAVHMYAPQTNYWVMGYAYGSTKMHVLILSNHAWNNHATNTNCNILLDLY